MRFISEDDADSRPLWMSPQEINNPSEFIREFCRTSSVADCRFFLWQMLSNSVSAENPDVNASAGEQLYFFENLMPFIEAVFLLQQTNEVHIANERSGRELGFETTSTSITEVDISVNNLNYHKNLFKIKECKFRKKLKHIRNHSIWYRQSIDDPFQVIRDFFDASSLTSFKANFYEVLRATSEDHFYDKGSPSDVSHYLERFESMINVGYLFNGSIESAPSSSEMQNNSQTSVKQNISDYEAPNPGEVITLFFTYKSLSEWKETLIEINDFALSKHPAHEWGVWIDTLSVFVHSIKLAEALYLIGRSQEE